MKLVYIAGPYRAPTREGIESNIQRAREAAEAVCRLGAYPVTPHLNTAHFDGVAGDQFFLDGTMELMRQCDFVLLVDGWEKSAGAVAEFDEAQRLGIKCCQRISDLDEELTRLDEEETRGLENTFRKVKTWQDNEPAFSGATANAAVLHMASELGELAAAVGVAPEDVLRHVARGASKPVKSNPMQELADVVFMVVQTASCLIGPSAVGDLDVEVLRKLRINKARNWKPSIDGIVEGGGE